MNVYCMSITHKNPVFSERNSRNFRYKKKNQEVYIFCSMAALEREARPPLIYCMYTTQNISGFYDHPAFMIIRLL